MGTRPQAVAYYTGATGYTKRDYSAFFAWRNGKVKTSQEVWTCLLFPISDCFIPRVRPDSIIARLQQLLPDLP